MRCWLVAQTLLITGLAFANITQAAVERLPITSFASLPSIRQVHLSPNGETIASIVHSQLDGKSKSVLTVLDINTNKTKSLLSTDNTKFKINWIRWANNQQILVSSDFPSYRGTTQTIETRLLVLNAKTDEIRSVWPENLINKFEYVPQLQDQIVDILPDDGNHILMELNGFLHNSSKLFKVSLNEEKAQPVHRSKQYIRNWMVDRQKNVRIIIELKGTDYQILHRFNEEHDWVTLWEFEAFSEDKVWPLGFDQNANILFVKALHNGFDAIFKVDLKKPKLEKELVLSKEGSDIDGRLIYSYKQKKVVGIRSYGGNTYWDGSFQKLQAGINRALPDTDNRIYSVSEDETQYLFLASSDVDAGTYYLIDKKKGEIKSIARKYPGLKPALMAEKRRVSYQARDGLNIEGFLTLPKGHKEGQKYPSVVFPHGGPISFDGTGFDYWTQFLANRGYAVLQMNFRGSSGYGHDFMKEGLQNWGLAMQDDVEDGTKWLIEQGYAKPDEICILGASYGGYAALMGVIKSPNLYQCAISFAGVMDQDLLIRNSMRYTNKEIGFKQIGSNAEELKIRSPLYNVKKITQPVLLIHGEQDRIVHVHHSRNMQKEMEKQAKQVTYLELKNGNHFLELNENRIATFEAIESFLSQHLNVE